MREIAALLPSSMRGAYAGTLADPTLLADRPNGDPVP
jgi:hypothetical protein